MIPNSYCNRLRYFGEQYSKFSAKADEAMKIRENYRISLEKESELLKRKIHAYDSFIGCHVTNDGRGLRIYITASLLDDEDEAEFNLKDFSQTIEFCGGVKVIYEVECPEDDSGRVEKFIAKVNEIIEEVLGE